MSEHSPTTSSTRDASYVDVVSPNTTGTDVDEDTIGSITKDFSHKFTPKTWTKALHTPTPSSISSNVSSVTYMLHNNFNNENATPMGVNQTPMRDLNPDYQDVPLIKCPLSTDSTLSFNSESPPVVKVLSPASQFRLKRSVFESKAQAVKSPGRKRRAQNVTVLESSPSQMPLYTESEISPSRAIESELGEDSVEESVEEAVVVTAHATAVPMSVPVLETTKTLQNDDFDSEKMEYTELQYEDPQQKVEEPVVVMNTLKSVGEPSQPSVRPEEGFNKPTRFMWLFMCIAVVLLAAMSAYSNVFKAAPLHITVVGTHDIMSVESEVLLVSEALVTPTEDAIISTAIVEGLDVAPSEEAHFEIDLSVLYKSSLFSEAREQAGELYTLLKHHCITGYVLVHEKISTYDAENGSHLRTAFTQLRGKTEAYLTVLGESVVQFQHQIDAMGIKQEWLKLKDMITTRMDKIDLSGVKSAIKLVKQEYAIHAPIVKERVNVELQNAHKVTVTNLLHMHRFIKEHELLADEFY